MRWSVGRYCSIFIIFYFGRTVMNCSCLCICFNYVSLIEESENIYFLWLNSIIRQSFNWYRYRSLNWIIMIYRFMPLSLCFRWSMQTRLPGNPLLEWLRLANVRALCWFLLQWLKFSLCSYRRDCVWRLFVILFLQLVMC